MKIPNILQILYHSVKRVYKSVFEQYGGSTQIDRKTGNEYMPKPKNTGKVTYSEDIKPFEKGVMDATSVQRKDIVIYIDTPDVVAEPEPTHPKPIVTKYPQLGDETGWKYAYYPAGGRSGKRPNMDAIRTWVENTKLGASSNFTMSESFGEEYGYIPFHLSTEKKKQKVKEIAYKVARKLWYVGRRPYWMTDVEWQAETKDMRPPEGSFNYKVEEKWNNFPYDETYKYDTGKYN
tara:strand:- start:136 stop:837 length:702 start_codon:yes stop_codon:yes gene_type:complete